MSGEITEYEGHPLYGREKEELKQFLETMGLTYDEQITYSLVLKDGEQIAATGSCQKNVIKCVAVRKDCQGQNLLGKIMTGLTRHFFEEGISHYFGFTKPENQEIFQNMGLYPIAKTDRVLLLENKKNGLEKFLKELQRETAQQQTVKSENIAGDGIGAIVANCNPFTGGHAYLIGRAAAACRWLHVFLVSEEQPFLRTEERYRLVQEGIGTMPNVILHKTSEYMISPAVFPTYFIKEKEQAYEINAALDITIFATRIAPALGIDRRYVGEEPFCAVTEAYNRLLKQMLGGWQIQVHEIPRKTWNGEAISASRVRECYQNDKLEQIREMLPETTYRYLEEKKHGERDE